VIRIGNSWAHAGLALVQIGAGDRLPFGCALLVIIVLSLLLWAILLILLLRLLHYIGGAGGDMKRPAVMRSCRSASTPITPRLTGFVAGSAVGKLLDGRPFRR
jgi:hypothetical protein